MTNNRCTTKSYHEMIQFPTFKERFDYLSEFLGPNPDSFGLMRYLNQRFYASKEWRNLRNYIISRDMACDLAHPDYELHEMAVIHHIVPLTIKDLEENSIYLMDPDFLVVTSEFTHKGLHNKNFNLAPKLYEPRTPNDTCPWRL